MVKKKERKPVLKGWTQRIKGGCGNIYSVINEDIVDGTKQLYESFIRLGKSGGCAAAFCEALGRSVSIGLSHGIPLQEYAEQFRGIQCHKALGDVGSCPDGISKMFELILIMIEKEKKIEEVKEDVKKREEEVKNKDEKKAST